MKTTLTRLTLSGEKPDVLLQRIITQDINACHASPKISAICSNKGKVESIFWIQHTPPGLSIWVEKSQAESLKNLIRHFDLFKHIDLSESDETVWADVSDTLRFMPTETHTQQTSWALYLINQMIPELTPQDKGRYTPHILGLDKHAICFEKGCFIGYEVVARVQFKGRTKRSLKQHQSKTKPDDHMNLCYVQGTYHYLAVS